MSKISRRKLIAWGSERLPEFPVCGRGKLAPKSRARSSGFEWSNRPANSDLRRAAIVDSSFQWRANFRATNFERAIANAVDPLATSFNGCRPAVCADCACLSTAWPRVRLRSRWRRSGHFVNSNTTMIDAKRVGRTCECRACSSYIPSRVGGCHSAHVVHRSIQPDWLESTTWRALHPTLFASDHVVFELNGNV